MKTSQVGSYRTLNGLYCHDETKTSLYAVELRFSLITTYWPRAPHDNQPQAKEAHEYVLYIHVACYVHVCVFISTMCRTPGNKPGSSPRGLTPDETGRRPGPSHNANSSASDLANSVTSEMLMVTHNTHSLIRL